MLLRTRCVCAQGAGERGLSGARRRAFPAQDISFYTNRAAVHLEMGAFAECIKDCDEAIEKGREIRADFKARRRPRLRPAPAARCPDHLGPSGAVRSAAARVGWAL